MIFMLKMLVYNILIFLGYINLTLEGMREGGGGHFYPPLNFWG